MNERAFNAGDRCGAYRIVRFIGRGRAAEVYEAVHIETGQAAALRRARADLAHDEQLQRRLLKEAEVLRKARHANVASVLAAGVHEGVPFTALEYVDGRTLRERLDEMAGPISLPVALCFAKQIADAAAAIHAAGSAHGDLRAESVRLTALDEVKLCDLGPEAPLSPPEKGDIRGDIRAVGLLVGEMLVGRPVSARSLGADLSRAPGPLRDLVQRAVFGDLEGGFASMEEVSVALDDAWSRFLEGTRSDRGGLRRALDALAGALQSIAKAPNEDGSPPDAGGEEGGGAPEDFAALLKGVLDATKALDPDGDEGAEEDAPPTDRDP